MRWRNFLLFLCVLALAALDLADDVEEGVELSHVWMEGGMILAALCGVAWEGARLRNRAVALEEHTKALNSHVETLRAESVAWQNEAHALSVGVSGAIDRQLERWGLTAAEKETALLLLKGLSHKEIADVRHVGEATARQQARAIYKKADLTGRHDLAAFFLEDLLVAGGAEQRAVMPAAE